MSSQQKYSTTAVFAAACIGMCFFGISMLVLGSVMPTLNEHFGLSNDQQTSLVTLLPIGILCGSVVFGPIVDRFGHKIMLVGNCAIVLAALLGVAYTQSLAVLQLSVFCIGFGGGVLNGETNGLVTDIYEGKTRNSRLSLLGVFYGLGALGIPMAMASLQKEYSYTVLLTAVGVILAVGVVYCMSVRFPAPKQPQGFPLKDAARVITSPALLLLSFILFFQSGTEGVTNNWTATLLTPRFAGDPAVAQIGLIAMLIGLTAARLLQTVIFNRVSAGRVLVVSLIVCMAGFIILFATRQEWLVYTAMALIGAGLASTFPVILGVVGEKFAALSGTAFSVALFIALLGQTALNFTVGEMADHGMVNDFPILLTAGLAIMLVLFAVYTYKFANKGTKP